jgi:hypothetical protein
VQIDWHDFTVVETIDFYDDEDDELPPPMSLKELIAFNKQQQAQGGMPQEAEAAEEDTDMAQVGRGCDKQQQELEAGEDCLGVGSHGWFVCGGGGGGSTFPHRRGHGGRDAHMMAGGCAV